MTIPKDPAKGTSPEDPIKGNPPADPNAAKNEEWVKIDYSVVSKELFEKYGVQPFEIMKKKMRNSKREVWNNINYFDAQTECKKLGFRLPNLKELMLLEYYKSSKKEIFREDKEFLGIQELSYFEDVRFEWVYFLDNIAFVRGGSWRRGAGAFPLSHHTPWFSELHSCGFRCVRNLIN